MTDIIKYYLCGSIGVETIKKEPYNIDDMDIAKAYQLALLMKEQYKMIADVDSFISAIKIDLKEEISNHYDEIMDIKAKLEASGEVL